MANVSVTFAENEYDPRTGELQVHAVETITLYNGMISRVRELKMPPPTTPGDKVHEVADFHSMSLVKWNDALPVKSTIRLPQTLDERLKFWTETKCGEINIANDPSPLVTAHVTEGELYGFQTFNTFTRQLRDKDCNECMVEGATGYTKEEYLAPALGCESLLSVSTVEMEDGTKRVFADRRLLSQSPSSLAMIQAGLPPAAKQEATTGDYLAAMYRLIGRQWPADSYETGRYSRLNEEQEKANK